MHVGILDDYQMIGNQFGKFDEIPGVRVTAFNDHLEEEDALAERLLPFDALVAMRERTAFPRSLLERLPNLRLLISTGGQNVVIDDGAAKDLGIVMCNTGGAQNTTPELAVGLLLAVTRHIPSEQAAVNEGKWQTRIGPGLAGNTLGILGLGRLGTKVAHMARAFDLNLIAWSQNLTKEAAEAVGAQLVTKDELFSNADFVTVHLRLSGRTTGLIGAHELRLLGPNGYLINTSRGPIVDEQALIQALNDGTIAGAGLDVFDHEPLPVDHPLRSTPRTVITPHIGYVSNDGYRKMFGDAREDIEAFLAGHPIRVVNP